MFLGCVELWFCILSVYVELPCVPTSIELQYESMRYVICYVTLLCYKTAPVPYDEAKIEFGRRPTGGHFSSSLASRKTTRGGDWRCDVNFKLQVSPNNS